jgi:hypothetical protein
MMRVFALGKICATLKRYTNLKKFHKLTQLDKSLLKGFYVKNSYMLEKHSEVTSSDEND